MIWLYDDEEKAVTAEKDREGDGRPDIWYRYRAGKLTQLEEDTNRDGKPDLWEFYDESEALIRRARDFNFDGQPDLVEEK